MCFELIHSLRIRIFPYFIYIFVNTQEQGSLFFWNVLVGIRQSHVRRATCIDTGIDSATVILSRDPGGGRTLGDRMLPHLYCCSKRFFYLGFNDFFILNFIFLYWMLNIILEAAYSFQVICVFHDSFYMDAPLACFSFCPIWGVKTGFQIVYVLKEWVKWKLQSERGNKTKHCILQTAEIKNIASLKKKNKIELNVP